MNSSNLNIPSTDLGHDIFDNCTKLAGFQRMFPGADIIKLYDKYFQKISPTLNGGPRVSSQDSTWLQFGTNDYLGMSVHPQVKQTAIDFINEYGPSMPMGSRLMTGTTELHLELEEKLAKYKKTEASLTFASGANAMLGTLCCLPTRKDVVILDKRAHKSLQMGAQLSPAEVRFFRHNDVDDLKKILESTSKKQGKIIVIDGVYSMDGDVAPLKEIVSLAKDYNARILMDDAHGNGVLGETGNGLAELEGLESEIDLHAGTFSKAFGVSGGFIAGRKDVIDFLKINAPTNIFTKSQPAVQVASVMKAMEIVTGPEGKVLREKLWQNTRLLQETLTKEGFQFGQTVTPITPIRFEGQAAIAISHILKEKLGIWTSSAIYPAVPLGSSIIRAIPTALHTPENILDFCEKLSLAMSVTMEYLTEVERKVFKVSSV